MLLIELGIKGIICDIDNTLVTYEQPEPPDEVINWIRGMNDSGVKIAFVSNNNKKRVELFNRSLSFHAYAASGKPSRRQLRAAMRAMGTNKSETVMLGDQIFTDVFSGKRLGLKCILVKPIADKNTLFFKIKRLLEKPFIFAYHKNIAKNKLD